MHPVIFLAAIIVGTGQTQSSTIDTNQQCQQLAREANIGGSDAADSLQRACQNFNGTSSTSRARTACSIFQAVFNHDPLAASNLTEYVDPHSRFYINRTESNWSDNCWQNAGCIVSPESVEDVARVMKIISLTQSTFSIRSGGHDFNVNHSSVGQAGILMDMANFKQTSLSADNTTMTIGVGARWGEVYQALNGSGVSVNGARSPNPAVGGQTLGGGIGFFSNVVGVCAASVIAAEVVLANSSIIRADNETNSDLLWALKGGGPNYGVVTSFTYKTLPIDDMWFESRIYTPDKNLLLLDALVAYNQVAVNDTKANILYQLSEDASSQSFVSFIYLEPVERPSIFSPFYDIPQSSTRITPTVGNLAELSSLYYDPVYPHTPPSRDYVVFMPHAIDNATYQESYAAFSTYSKLAASLGAVMNYGSQPITPNAVQASSDTPLNLTHVNQDWAHVTIEWDSSENDARIRELMQRMGESILSSAVKHGADLPYRFMNDAYDGQQVLSGYGAGNLETLWRIARAYDPDGVFQRLQNGGWLLNRA